MGGSGAGKTSLLNALCGRAFYGETTGKIYVNGHEARIDDHKGVTGFVPQDDIVYAELTVKECLVYSGRFKSPRDTPLRYVRRHANYLHVECSFLIISFIIATVPVRLRILPMPLWPILVCHAWQIALWGTLIDAVFRAEKRNVSTLVLNSCRE